MEFATWLATGRIASLQDQPSLAGVEVAVCLSSYAQLPGNAFDIGNTTEQSYRVQFGTFPEPHCLPAEASLCLLNPQQKA